MKKAYIKVIPEFYSGRNTITPANKVETVGRKVKNKILMLTQKAKNIVNTPWNQASEDRHLRTVHQRLVTTSMRAKVPSGALHEAVLTR